MAERPTEKRQEARREAESFTGGPGVVATKSQAQGSLIGAPLGAAAGIVIGLIIGLVAFGGGSGLVVSLVVGAVGGGVVGAVAGGGARPTQKLEGSEGDI
jgi:hypothetical protein